MSGKGSNPRPFSVDANTFAANWERIFSDAPKPNGAACASKATCLVGSIPTGAAIYVDADTGKQVNESWWPGDPL